MNDKAKGRENGDKEMVGTSSLGLNLPDDKHAPRKSKAKTRKPERLEDVIEIFCGKWARTNQRPDMKDPIIVSMFSVELAREIRKYATVTRISGNGDNQR